VLTFLPVSTWDTEFVRSIREHYSESRGAPPGKKLAWRIIENGRHRGWIGLGEPAFKLSPRRRLGLIDARPLPQTVCCFIYRIESEGAMKASEILGVWHDVATAQWVDRYKLIPIHWETMIDPSRIRGINPGACFKRVGYRSLGMTTGRQARRPSGHTRGPRIWLDGTPKLVLYRGPLPRIPKEPPC
jgi:hypothetical protein